MRTYTRANKSYFYSTGHSSIFYIHTHAHKMNIVFFLSCLLWLLNCLFLNVRCGHFLFVYVLVKFVLYLWKLNLKVTPVNYGRYSVHYRRSILVIGEGNSIKLSTEFVQMLCGKIWKHFYSPSQLWIDCVVDWSFYLWSGNRSRRRKTLKSNQLYSAWKLTLCCILRSGCVNTYLKPNNCLKYFKPYHWVQIICDKNT